MTTDTDRLRQAADVLEQHYVGVEVDDWEQDRATVALLRAVADWHHHVTLPGEDQGICVPCQMIWPCTQAGAALALADTIPGSRDG